MSRRGLAAAATFVVVLVSGACDQADEMPDVLGMHEDEATETLENAGIEDWTVKWIEGPKRTVVTRQVPDPGEAVTPDEEVFITLDGR